MYYSLINNSNVKNVMFFFLSSFLVLSAGQGELQSVHSGQVVVCDWGGGPACALAKIEAVTNGAMRV